jgi:hypothetical protein
MGEDHDKRSDAAAPEKPPKIKANDNPWYLLATLYGEPDGQRDHKARQKLENRNRVAWNRYFAANLDDEVRAHLIGEKRHPEKELTPYSADELDKFAAAFGVRYNSVGADFSMPSAAAFINFDGVEFDRPVDFCYYIFPDGATFDSTTFAWLAGFEGATFFNGAIFFACNLLVYRRFPECCFLRTGYL